MTLTFDELLRVSQERRDAWHPPESVEWSGADWSNATMGEVGELIEVVELLAISSAITRHGGTAANLVKKIRRHETGLGEKIPKADLLVELGKEMADVVSYLVILADHYDIDLGDVTAQKFNEVSIRQGLPQRLPTKADVEEGVEFEGEPGWECRCGHNSMRHDRVQTHTIYPCAECDCTFVTPAEEAP